LKTFTELKELDAAARNRAVEYERLLSLQSQLRTTITKLKGQAINVSALQHMQTYVKDVPPELITRGSRLVPGGFLVRDTLTSVIADALDTATRRAREVASELSTATGQLSQVERELKKFE
jgi:hypothetical protein